MASSSSSRLWEYVVFLSFRGEDTRKTFVSHLYKELDTKGIVTFKDDRELDVGDHISTEISKAIQDSKFAVVVLSHNFVSSRWCLEELLMIMELQVKHRLTVVPIFYGVDPSDVRQQRRNFTLERYEGSTNAAKIPKWKEALTRIANISGKDTREFKDDATMIDEIVESISRQLLPMQPKDFSDIVGMNAHMERLEPLLSMESKGEVRMIGIWGMGGVGKTTIAKCLYAQFSGQFSAYYFMEGLRTRHGYQNLQEELLTNILRQDRLTLWSVDTRSQPLIKSKLGHRRVFVVLDDVDNVEQLDALARETNWFGPGSRIIITTRDKGLLCFARVDIVYEVKCLDDDEALQIFKQIVFEGGNNHSSDGYEQLSIQASRLARGLPSAVRAFGLCLRRKTSPKEWEATLHKFKTSPQKTVVKMLRTSYDSLDDSEKTVFVHIACLLNGDPVRHVTTLLEDGELDVNLGLERLTEKSLIEKSGNGCIIMHDLVEQMGRKIVREESMNKPWRQRFLWNHEEICDVLADSTGTKHIECMALHFCEMHAMLSMRGEVFNRMPNLKFLKFYKHLDNINSMLQLTPEFRLLPRKLKLLHWRAYPLTTLPPVFQSECLVELNLRYSNLENLRDETKDLSHLKRLDVTGSQNLRELPDLSKTMQLEELIMDGCTRLGHIPESISSLSCLRKLNACDCDLLMTQEITIGVSDGIQERRLGRCPRITVKFPNAVETLNSLTDLSIDGTVKIEIPHLRGDAEHLSYSYEEQIPRGLMMMEHQTPELMSEFYSLKYLHIMRFNYIEDGVPFRCHSFSNFIRLTELSLTNLNIEVIPDDISHLLVLEKLDLSGNDFKNLPKSMEQLYKLENVRLCNCRNLEALPRLTRLNTLTLSDCVNLQMLLTLPDVQKDQGRYSLLLLGLNNCKNIQSLSDQLAHFTNLMQLDLSEHGFETLPTSTKDLSLTTLCLDSCAELRSLAELPPSLVYLYAQGCKSLETVSLSPNHSMKHLDLSYCFSLTQHEHLITQFLAQNEEVSQRFTCLPGREVPSYFDRQAAENCITISLPHNAPASKFVGFDACVAIACYKPFVCSAPLYDWKWETDWVFGMILKPDFLQTPERTDGDEEEDDVTSDHLFIFHIPTSINKDVYEFQFKSHIEYSDQEFQFPPGVIKSCGVRLIFEDDHTTRT